MLSSSSVRITFIIHSSGTTACWLLNLSVLSEDFLYNRFLTTSKLFLCFYGVFEKNCLSKFTYVGGASSSESIALFACTSLLFSWTTCKVTVLDELTLFNAWGGNELVFANLTMVVWSSSDVFRCQMWPCDLDIVWWTSSFGGHRFLSLWDALVLFDRCFLMFSLASL